MEVKISAEISKMVAARVTQMIARLLSKHKNLSSNPESTKKKKKPVLAAHTCNPSYSGGRDQEDHDLKPDWANSS
jgi:hypothetical protein